MDIVKRLRAMDEEQFYHAPATSYRDCQEAAAEIERLRSALAAEREACAKIVMHQTTRTADETTLLDRIIAAIRARST